MRVFLVVFGAVVWIAGLCGVLFWRDPDLLLNMSPDQLGEFLSGAFGPPTFVALLATLIQQGDGMKRQGEQIDRQLRSFNEQVAVQTKQAEAAERQAAAAAELTSLEIERMQIERISNRVNALAMLAVRYSDRLILRSPGNGDVVPLIGSKDDLRRDFDAGPEAVLETLRIRVRANLERFKSIPIAPLSLSNKQSCESLLANLIQRALDTHAAMEAGAAGIQEIEMLKADLALRETERRLRDILDLVKNAPTT